MAGPVDTMATNSMIRFSTEAASVVVQVLCQRGVGVRAVDGAFHTCLLPGLLLGGAGRVQHEEPVGHGVNVHAPLALNLVGEDMGVRLELGLGAGCTLPEPPCCCRTMIFVRHAAAT